MREVELADPVGVRVYPDQLTGLGVLVLAGSSGRVDVDRARVFARAGAIAEAIRWFGGPGQNPGPWDIPLELFIERVAALKAECDRVAVVGTSFGSEAALLTGANCSDVNTVIALAPSEVAWGAWNTSGEPRPHWTLAGRPIPYVPFVDGWKAEADPPSYRSLYERSRAAAPEAVRLATIPVERITSLILVAGGDDLVWPSDESARLIAERRQRHGLETVVVTNADAGHLTVLPGEEPPKGGMRMLRGGNLVADRENGDAAWTEITRLVLS